MIERRWTLWLRVGGDMAIAVAAYFFAFWLRMNVPLPLTEKLLPSMNADMIPHLWSIIALSQGAVMYFSGCYDEGEPDKGLPMRPVASAATLLTLLLIAFYFFIDVKFPRTVFVLFWAVDLPLLLAWQWGVSKLQVPAQRRRAVLVGVNETSLTLLREIQRRPGLGLDVVGLVEAGDEAVAAGAPGAPRPNEAGGLPVLGHRDELSRIVTDHRVDHIILTPRPSWQDRLIDELGTLQGRRARVTLVPSPFEIIIGKPQQRRVHDIPLIDFLREPMGPSSRFVKRAMDIAGALLLLLLVLPVLAATAVAVKIVSPGPVFYRQVRVGRNGRNFSIIKFRTMVVNAEKLTGAVLAQKDDPRVFPLGRFMRKTRIDELPQVFNILSGDMSFVGPRPERPEFVNEFRREIPGYAERLRVKPGVTGLAQVNGYYETTAENKLKYDLTYIYNHSIFLDVKILVATVKVVLTGRGT